MWRPDLILVNRFSPTPAFSSYCTTLDKRVGSYSGLDPANLQVSRVKNSLNVGHLLFIRYGPQVKWKTWGKKNLQESSQIPSGVS
jgi:hypothetical protein